MYRSLPQVVALLGNGVMAGRGDASMQRNYLDDMVSTRPGAPKCAHEHESKTQGRRSAASTRALRPAH